MWRYKLNKACDKGYQINLEVLQEIANKPVMKWSFISDEEFTSAIAKYNNSSTLELNKLS